MNTIALFPIDQAVLTGAGAFGRPTLRTLDGVQLASAVSLLPLDAFVSYDERQCAAARLAGLRTVSPRCLNAAALEWHAADTWCSVVSNPTEPAYSHDMARSSLAALGSISPQNRRELILDRLRTAISSGELAPGTHLAEIELSDALGVSRGTLREALRHLQQDGLLVSDFRGRLYVRVVTEQEVDEIFDVRCALETLAFAKICARADRLDIAEKLQVSLEALRDAEGDFTSQVDADLALHERMCELSGNETLRHTWLGVSGLARAAITAAGPETALHNMSYQRHKPIVTLLEAGDTDGGRDFLRQHMRDAAERIVGRMSAREATSA